jgi:sterol desaturase/sphingolipid hydroxylase (fatty acid hydroxylase superfamily)
MSARRGPDLLTLALAGAVVVVVVGERLAPLRPRRDPSWRRDLRNVGVAVLAAAAVQAVERPLAGAAVRWAERRRWGLHRLLAPAWMKTAAAVIWLDYGLYVWHVLLHREPLWRLHRAHHSDLELTASTALRLHFAEMALSGPWRAAQVALLGLGAGELELWRRLTLAATLFQHANLRLPAWLDRTLSAAVVTPRMHGIHHSIVPDEVGSNWSTIFSYWDRLYGTLKLDRPQPERIGLPDVRDPRRLTLAGVLALP